MSEKSDNEKSIQQLLTDYAATSAYPFHMPGHKRNTELTDGVNYPFSIDITEISGFDDLHNADGILKNSMEKASRLFGSESSSYLVNGSTCGILSSIYSLTDYGDTVIVARNCHKSVFHAIELRGLEPVFISPEFDGEFEISASVTPKSVLQALTENKNARLVILTSPTYEGVVSNIEKIAEVCHSFFVPLVVDEAHGAHLCFSDFFPKSALAAGADVVIQSLHKTLPCPTQTAVIHTNGSLVDKSRLHRSLGIFQTSSPSYPMMSSIDLAVRMLEKHGAEYFKKYEKLLAYFSEKMKGLNNLRVLCFGDDLLKNHKAIFDFDKSKLVISCKNTSITGKELFSVLRDKFGLELEMASGSYVVAMTSICDTKSGFDRLADALLLIDKSIKQEEKSGAYFEYSKSTRVLSPAQALKMSFTECSIDNAENKVSGEYIWAYPPGVPIVIPGEAVTADILKRIDYYRNMKIRLVSSSGKIENGRLLAVNVDKR